MTAPTVQAIPVSGTSRASASASPVGSTMTAQTQSTAAAVVARTSRAVWAAV
ncbi:MAG: hypothetical protein ACOYBY_10955 [Dermatophilaceae bacterium]